MNSAAVYSASTMVYSDLRLPLDFFRWLRRSVSRRLREAGYTPRPGSLRVAYQDLPQAPFSRWGLRMASVETR